MAGREKFAVDFSTASWIPKFVGSVGVPPAYRGVSPRYYCGTNLFVQSRRRDTDGDPAAAGCYPHEEADQLRFSGAFESVVIATQNKFSNGLPREKNRIVLK